MNYNNNSKISIVLWGIGGIILTALITILQPQIKSLLGLNPKLFWQLNTFYSNNRDIKNIYKISIYNDSAASGELVITTRGQYNSGDFVISGVKSKPVFENDTQNTYIKISQVYPEDSMDITLISSSTPYKLMEVGSKDFVMKEVYPFPFEQKYNNNGLTFFCYVLFAYTIIFLLYFLYGLGKIKGKHNTEID